MSQQTNNEAAVVTGLTPTGIGAMGLYRGVPSTLKIIDVDVNGKINANVTVTPGPPGGDLNDGASTAFAGSDTHSLAVPPANPRTQIVSVVNSPGALVLIRKVGAGAGRGIPLYNGGVFVYSKGIVALEGQEIAGAPATVNVSWETN